MPIDLRLDPHEVSHPQRPLRIYRGGGFLRARDEWHRLVRSHGATLSVQSRLYDCGRIGARAGDRRGFPLRCRPRSNYLESLHLFKPEFLQHLAQLRFTGSIRAIADGSIFFPGEPVMEVRGPLIEAQLLEPLILNQLGFASLTATKAARCFSVASGRQAGRVRAAPRAGRRCHSDRRALQLSRGIQWHLESARGQALRDAGVRHHES